MGTSIHIWFFSVVKKLFIKFNFEIVIAVMRLVYWQKIIIVRENYFCTISECTEFILSNLYLLSDGLQWKFILVTTLSPWHLLLYNFFFHSCCFSQASTKTSFKKFSRGKSDEIFFPLCSGKWILRYIMPCRGNSKSEVIHMKWAIATYGESYDEVTLDKFTENLLSSKTQNIANKGSIGMQ